MYEWLSRENADQKVIVRYPDAGQLSFGGGLNGFRAKRKTASGIDKMYQNK